MFNQVNIKDFIQFAFIYIKSSQVRKKHTTQSGSAANYTMTK
ncbi:hypothetical protein PLUTE_a2720 [Pseudoalteromonas luteoviolacea DSM 6061]|nr:hypothetical protein [Pseudoalteromonas luteoviolacea DSM 6061]